MRFRIIVLSVISFLVIISLGLQQKTSAQTSSDTPYIDELPVIKPSERKVNSTCRGTFSTLVEKIIDTERVSVSFCNRDVRLALIDGLEGLNDSVARSARSFMRSRCTPGLNVTIDQDSNQRYDKSLNIVGVLYCNGSSINAELIYRGLARIDNQSCKNSEFIDYDWAKPDCFGFLNGTKKTVTVLQPNLQKVIDIEENVTEEESRCEGCLLGDECFPYGHRISGLYCAPHGEFVQQIRVGGACTNDSQCRNGLCTSGICRNLDITDMIVGWIKEILNFSL